MSRHPDEEGRDQMRKAVDTREARDKKWRDEGERPLWKNFQMIGALGWLIVVPMLLGVLAGRWLDGKFGTGITFTGALIVVGAAFGFYLAWQRMNED